MIYGAFVQPMLLALVRRLAAHYPDTVIAGILNRQGRTTARGLRFTANLVGNVRRHWNVPRFEPPAESPEGELLSIQQAAKILDIAPSTARVHLHKARQTLRDRLQEVER